MFATLPIGCFNSPSQVNYHVTSECGVAFETNKLRVESSAGTIDGQSRVYKRWCKSLVTLAGDFRLRKTPFCGALRKHAFIPCQSPRILCAHPLNGAEQCHMIELHKGGIHEFRTLWIATCWPKKLLQLMLKLALWSRNWWRCIRVERERQASSILRLLVQIFIALTCASRFWTFRHRSAVFIMNDVGLLLQWNTRHIGHMYIAHHVCRLHRLCGAMP